MTNHLDRGDRRHVGGGPAQGGIVIDPDRCDIRGQTGEDDVITGARRMRIFRVDLDIGAAEGIAIDIVEEEGRGTVSDAAYRIP